MEQLRTIIVSDNTLLKKVEKVVENDFVFCIMYVTRRTDKDEAVFDVAYRMIFNNLMFFRNKRIPWYLPTSKVQMVF